MRLSDLKRGDRAIIRRIDAEESLRRRLASFGVGRGAKLVVETYSIGRKTYEIIVDGTHDSLKG